MNDRISLEAPGLFITGEAGEMKIDTLEDARR